MQSEVSTAGADQDRGRRVEELERELVEAHEQQRATTEILQVISLSPTETAPVFKAILQHAVNFSGAAFGVVYRFDGEFLHVVAHHNFTAGNAPGLVITLSFTARSDDGDSAFTL